MRYPIVSYRNNEAGSTSSFRGLNRCDRGNGGEWLDCMDIDTGHYPCLAPRFAHKNIEAPAGVIRCCCEPLRDSGVYEGFTGVIYDGTNCCFYYCGKIMKVGSLSSDTDSISRTALWIYDDTDEVADEEMTEFDASRIEWSVVCINGRFVINGYDAQLKRGKYFVFTPNTGIVVPAEEQVHMLEDEYILEFGKTRGANINYDEYAYINYIKSTAIDFSKYFNEGDYLLITADYPKQGDMTDTAYEKLRKKCDSNNIRPYAKSGNSNAKYAVIREIISEYNSSDELTSSTIYYYATTPEGKFHNASAVKTSAALGTFVPPMVHITAYGNRIWGVNPEEDCVYASVFDTPFKMMNTDAQLDAAMSWQVELGTSDEAVGIISAMGEILALKKNSIIRINGSAATSFSITGIFRNCGCIDIHSAAEASGIIYYLGYNGFYMYDGSQPQIISAKLNCRYSEAVGFTDGDKYYVIAKRADTVDTEFLVYDIRYGVWNKWSNATGEAVGAFRVGRVIYLASVEGETSYITALCGGEGYTDNWYGESVYDFESVNDFKCINNIYIRARIDDGEVLTILTSVNCDDFTEHEPLESKGRIYLYKVPVRIMPGDFWQFKIAGSGGAVVHNIEYEYSDSGRRHYGNR